MILELDAGNSRIKWRQLDATGARIAGGIIPAAAEAAIDLTAIRDITGIPQQIRMATVADDQRQAELSKACESCFGIRPWLAVTQAKAGDVRNGYTVVEQLGVDRWLAALAARRRVEGNCLIIDAGTALTLDYLGADGVFRGGSIVPGFQLLERSLLGGTGRVRFQPAAVPEAPDIGIGDNTAAAVAAGIAMAFYGAIEQALLLAGKAFDQQFTVLVTGGDADQVLQALAGRGLALQHHADLVLDGLAPACEADQCAG